MGLRLLERVVLLVVRWLLPPLLLLGWVLFHPPTLASALCNLALMALAQSSSTKPGSRKKKSELRQIVIRSVDLLSRRIGGVEAMLVEGAVATYVTVQCVEIRLSWQEALRSLFTVRPVDIVIAGVRVRQERIPQAGAGDAVSGTEEAGDLHVWEPTPPPPLVPTSPPPPSSPFSKLTHDPTSWRMVVWACKVAQLSIQDVLIEGLVPSSSDVEDGGVVVATAGFSSMVITGNHVVHPRQALDVQVAVKAVRMTMDRQVLGVGTTECTEEVAALDLQGFSTGVTLEPMDHRMAAVFLSLDSVLRMSIDPSRLPPPPPKPSPPPPHTAKPALLQHTPSACDTEPLPPTAAPPTVRDHDGWRSASACNGDTGSVGPEGDATGGYLQVPAERCEGGDGGMEVDLTTIPRRGYMSFPGVEVTVRGPGGRPMIINTAFDATWISSTVLPRPRLTSRGRLPVMVMSKRGGRSTVCLVPRMACRHIRVELEGSKERVFGLQDWKVDGLVDVEALPGPELEELPVQQARKVRVQKVEIESDIGAVGIGMSGEFMRWAKTLSSSMPKPRPKLHEAPPPPSQHKPGPPPAPSHKVAYNIRRFRLSCDRLESWEEDPDVPPTQPYAISSAYVISMSNLSVTATREVGPLEAGMVVRAGGFYAHARMIKDPLSAGDVTTERPMGLVSKREKEPAGGDDDDDGGGVNVDVGVDVSGDMGATTRGDGEDRGEMWSTARIDEEGDMDGRLRSWDGIVGDDEPDETAITITAKGLEADLNLDPVTGKMIAASIHWTDIHGEEGLQGAAAPFVHFPSAHMCMEVAPDKDQITITAPTCAAKFTIDLFVKGIQLQMLSKRTQLSMNRFTAAMSQSNKSSSNHHPTGAGASPKRMPRGFEMRMSVQHMDVDIYFSDQGHGFLTDMHSFKYTMVDAPRRSPTGACTETLVDVQRMVMTAMSGPGGPMGKVFDFTGLRVNMSKTTELALHTRRPQVHMSTSVTADELVFNVPPLVPVGVILGAAIEQRAGMDLAFKRWACSFGGRDRHVPPPFIPQVMRSHFRTFRVLFEPEHAPHSSIRTQTVSPTHTHRHSRADTQTEEEVLWCRSDIRDATAVATKSSISSGSTPRSSYTSYSTSSSSSSSSSCASAVPYTMEATFIGFQVDCDMTNPPAELRSLAQAFDSDTSAKNWGSVVGGDTLIAAEAVEVNVAGLDSPFVVMGPTKVHGMMVGASPVPKRALAVHADVPLTLLPLPTTTTEEEDTKGEMEGRSSSTIVSEAGEDGVLMEPCSTTAAAADVSVDGIGDGDAGAEVVPVGGAAAERVGVGDVRAWEAPAPSTCARARARVRKPVVLRFVKDGLPMKLYSDCTLESTYLQLVYGVCMGPAIEAVTAISTRVSPPSTASDPVPLAWWDKMRFLLHGNYAVKIAEVHYWNLTAATLSTASLENAISLHMAKLDAMLMRSLHEFRFDTFVMALPSHPPPGSPEDLSAGPPPEPGQPPARHRFAFFPNTTLRFRYSWACAEPFGHHVQPDLTRPELLAVCDRYARFRAEGLALEIDLNISGMPLVEEASSMNPHDFIRTPPHVRSPSSKQPLSLPVSRRPWVAVRLDLLSWLNYFSRSPDPPPDRPVVSLGTLLNYMNFLLTVEWPCVSFWPGRRIGMRKLHSEAAETIDTRGLVLSFRDLRDQITREATITGGGDDEGATASDKPQKGTAKTNTDAATCTPATASQGSTTDDKMNSSKHNSNTTATDTSTTWRTLMSRHDADDGTMVLASFMLCYRPCNWQSLSPPAGVEWEGFRDAVFADTARFSVLLDRIVTAAQPEDFIAGVKNVEVTADNGGEEGDGADSDEHDLSLKRRSFKALEMSRSYSSSSSMGSTQDLDSTIMERQNSCGSEEELAAAFKPSIASFVTNHRMLRPPVTSLPPSYHVDLPRSEMFSTGPRSAMRTRTSGVSSNNDLPRRTSSLTPRPEAQSFRGYLTCWVVVATELRLLWTLSSREALTHFAKQWSSHMRTYYGKEVAKEEGKPSEEGGDMSSSDTEDEEDTPSPPALATWFSNESSVTGSVRSSVMSPPTSPLAPSALTKMYLGSRVFRRGASLMGLPSNRMSRGSINSSIRGVSAFGANGGPGASHKKPQKKDFHITYKVVLLHPQVNFHSDNACGSLIIAASEAYLEGRLHEKLFKQRRPPLPPKSPPPPNGEAAAPTHLNDQRRKKRVLLLEKSERWLRIDDMRAFVVPLDVEVSQDVHWLEVAPIEEMAEVDLGMTVSGPGQPNLGGPPKQKRPYDFRHNAVIREVVHQFRLTFASIAFSPATLPLELVSKGVASSRIQMSSEGCIDKVLLDLPQLNCALSSRQFYITLDVVRNVLLAAPVQVEEEAPQSSLPTTTLTEESPGGRLDLNAKADREVLKSLVDMALQKVVPTEQVETRIVQYCVGGGTWKVKSEAGIGKHLDSVEVGFTGFSGNHVYYLDGSTDSTMEVESFWVRNLTPGPDSTVFEDVSTVLSPIVLDRQPCQRCGQAFDPDNNGPLACVFHAKEDGVLGEFKLRVVGEEFGGLGGEGVDGPGRWTCCGATHETAKGCCSRPHVAKEVMVSVRARSNPSIEVQSIPVQVYSMLEISIFPGANYRINIQLTRDIAELFHAYFLTHESTAHAGAGAEGVDTPNLLFGVDQVQLKHQRKKTTLTSMLAGRGNTTSTHTHTATNSNTAVSTPPHHHHGRPTGGTRFIGSPRVRASSEAEAGVKGKESAVLVKYVRFGDLNVQVSINGFAIKLDGYRASVPAFVRQGKVLTWNRLARKFEKHVVWSVTTQAASQMVGGGKKDKFQQAAALLHSASTGSHADPTAFLGLGVGGGGGNGGGGGGGGSGPVSPLTPDSIDARSRLFGVSPQKR